MTYQSESSFASKTGRFGQLVLLCQSFGVRYAPIHPSLQLPHLQQIQQQAEQSLHNCSLALTQYQTSVDNRRDAFDQLETVPASIMAVLRSNFADENTLTRASFHVRKLRGGRAKAIDNQPDPNDPNASPKKTRSVSQRSYVDRVQHFSNFIDHLSNEAAYQTNEPSLQIRQLQTKLAQLAQLNQDVATTAVALKTNRDLRNQLFSKDDNNSIPAIAKAVKNYVLLTFGSSSDEYTRIVRIRI